MSAVVELKQGFKIDVLRHLMEQLPQLELKTTHHFADGMYCRELFRPAGSLIVGKVHKREHFYMIINGTVIVASNEGAGKEYSAPSILISRPGTRRAVFAVTDATCVTVHRTNNRDLDTIEDELIEPDPAALFDARNELKGLIE